MVSTHGRALLHYLPPHGDSYYDLIINAQFLRADSYDPRKAANCFVRHFETKLEDTYEGGYCNKRLLLLIALTVSWSTTTDNYQQLKLFLLSKASIAPIVDDSAD